jgi:hypothetical protein
MVRILKVKELEERKHLLLARSEMLRQTLQLEVANIGLSTSLLQRRLKVFQKSSQVLGLAISVAGLFFFRRRGKDTPKTTGILSKLYSGLKLFGQLRPLFQKKSTEQPREPKRKDMPHLS